MSNTADDNSKRIVVIGAGQAAGNLIDGLRMEGFGGEIV